MAYSYNLPIFHNHHQKPPHHPKNEEEWRHHRIWTWNCAYTIKSSCSISNCTRKGNSDHKYPFITLHHANWIMCMQEVDAKPLNLIQRQLTLIMKMIHNDISGSKILTNYSTDQITSYGMTRIFHIKLEKKKRSIAKYPKHWDQYLKNRKRKRVEKKQMQTCKRMLNNKSNDTTISVDYGSDRMNFNQEHHLWDAHKADPHNRLQGG